MAALMKKLPPISEKQKEWVKKQFSPKGYKLKDKIWCNCCGEEFCAEMPPLDIHIKDGSEFMCPHCGEMLKIENCRANKKKEEGLMTIVTTCGGWQVLRHVEVMKYMYKLPRGINAEKVNYAMCEVLQEWIDEHGAREVVARPLECNSYRYSFSWTSELSLKRENYNNRFAYQIEGDVYPIKKVLPILKRNGFKYIEGRTNRLSDIFIHLLTDSRFETLMKTGQMKLADYCLQRYLPDIWASAKIAIRNHYQVKEPSLWVDIIYAMSKLGADIRNRKYVCPQDLRTEHDKWMKALSRKEKRDRREADQRKLESDIEKAKSWEQRYKEEKERYFDVMIEGNGIIVTPIPSVEAMREEAAAMHHCVFTHEYYKRPDSLILSARDQKGKRVETIEVNLTVLKIVQCYGVCNTFTEHHQEILDLVNDNMWRIKERRNQILEAV